MPTFAAWCARYGDWYDTDEERRAGYADYLRNRAELAAAFNTE